MRALLLLLLSAAAAAETHTIETEHYKLDYEGERKDADEAAALLEAAWPQWAAFFQKKPSTSKKSKLPVRFFATREAWVAALEADKVQGAGQAGGIYWPPTRTAYLYKQPTRYYTRVLLLHEATHQFHYLARTKNLNVPVKWYAEGVAEYLSWHDWDGIKLTLGVIPQVSLLDRAGAALRLASSPQFEFEKYAEAKEDLSRDFAWSMVRFLATGDEGKPFKNFKKYIRKLDAGNNATPNLWKYFQRPKPFLAAYRAWLEKNQQPFVQVFNEWQSLGPGRLRGFAGVISACRVGVPVKELLFTIEVPRERVRWRAGALLHWTSNDDWSYVMIDWSGFLTIRRRVGKTWKILEQGKGPAPGKDGNYRFQLYRKKGKVYLIFPDGTSYGAWELPGDYLGLAIDNCDVRFKDISWKRKE